MLIVLVQTAAAWFMAGSIWTMQVLNYPLLARVGSGSFTDYEQAHNRRFVIVVGPGVAVTAVTAVLLLIVRPDPVNVLGPVLVVVLLAAVIVLTVGWQAPAHTRLARGFDAEVLRSLVRTNLLRAIAWTLIGLVDVVMLIALSGS